MQNRQTIRKAVKAAIEALPEMADVPVFAQRRVEIDSTTGRFVTVAFASGDESRKTLAEIEDEAELLVRVHSSKVLNTDDDIDETAEPIEQLLASFTHASIDDITRGGWQYGDSEEAPFSYLEITYNIEFTEQF